MAAQAVKDATVISRAEIGCVLHGGQILCEPLKKYCGGAISNPTYFRNVGDGGGVASISATSS
jgi:hypothetical protein